MEHHLPTRRLVLTLYRSLLTVAAKYDKNIPCTKNPLFLMALKEKENVTESSIRAMVREPFMNNKRLTENKKITAKIQDAFTNMKLLYQFYQPSLSWLPLLDQTNSHVPFEKVLLTISEFDNESGVIALASQLDKMKQRIDEELNKKPQITSSTTHLRQSKTEQSTPLLQSTEQSTPFVQSTEHISADQDKEQLGAAQHSVERKEQLGAEQHIGVADLNDERAQQAIQKLIVSLNGGKTETHIQQDHSRAKRVIAAIVKVVYQEMGLAGTVSPAQSKDSFLLSGLLANKTAAYPVITSLLIALAQRENVELYGATCNGRVMLRYSYLQEPKNFHAADVFIDVMNGTYLPGLKLANVHARNSQVISSSISVTLPMDNVENFEFVTKMVNDLSKYSIQWREHYTVVAELAKHMESKEAPKKTAGETVAKSKTEMRKTDKESENEHTTSPLSPSQPTITPPTRRFRPVSSPSATSSPTSSASTSSPDPSSPAPSEPEHASPGYLKYFSSFLSLFSPRARAKTPTKSTATQSQPATVNTEKAHQKEGEEGGEEAGGEKKKKTGGQKGRYPRMWSSTELNRNPKTRRF